MGKHTVFARAGGAVTLVICAEEESHPRLEHAEAAADAWVALNVGTIVNMADDVWARKSHRQMWSSHDMGYFDLSMEDSLAVAPRHTLCDELLRVYAAHVTWRGAERAILVNCAMGMNRSALAVALLLWHTTPPAERPWANADGLIAYMRGEQKVQRGLGYLSTLNNPRFVDFLRLHCVAALSAATPH